MAACQVLYNVDVALFHFSTEFPVRLKQSFGLAEFDQTMINKRFAEYLPGADVRRDEKP